MNPPTQGQSAAASRDRELGITPPTPWPDDPERIEKADGVVRAHLHQLTRREVAAAIDPEAFAEVRDPETGDRPGKMQRHHAFEVADRLLASPELAVVLLTHLRRRALTSAGVALLAVDELPRGFRRVDRYLDDDEKAMAAVLVEGLGLQLTNLSCLVLTGSREGIRLEVTERDR